MQMFRIYLLYKHELPLINFKNTCMKIIEDLWKKNFSIKLNFLFLFSFFFILLSN